MVTAIVIPVIIFIFYIRSKREYKKYYDAWIALANIKEDSSITGTVYRISEEKQRFYYNQYVFVTDLNITTNQKKLKLKRIVPITKNFIPPTIQKGEELTFYGTWEKDYFRFTNYERKK